MTRGRRLPGLRLSLAALAAAAALTFGAGASAEETCPAEDSPDIPQPVPVELARPRSERPVEKPCLFRDPDDGACYASADAADRVWLAGGKAKLDARMVAVTLLAAANGSEVVEEDPDEEEADAEDGGALALVDSVPPSGGVLPSFSELKKSEKPSLWANMVRKMKGLVVRKTDSLPVSLPEDDLTKLFETGFPIPVEDFPREKFRDTFNNPRGRHRRHHAIDLAAPRGTPVVAVVDGVVERMGRDRKGGKVCYLRDTSGKFVFYYAHLASHAEGLRVGDTVKRGTKLGEVGSTGHVIGGPHLHFAIFRELEGESLFKGLAVNPYLVFSTLGLK